MTRRQQSSALVLTVALLLATSPAEAHVFGAGGAGFLEGLGHPLAGWDHLLAMLAVGIWASQIGRPAWWMLPMVFPAAMAGGGVLGWLGVPVPAVEAGIALSVLVLGVLIGFAVRPALSASIPLVALFAVFHGHAHGVELPETASPTLYGLGFILATLTLHLMGLALGSLVRLREGGPALRWGGGAMAVAGLVLFLGQ